SMLGNLAALPLPDGAVAPTSPLHADPLQLLLYDRHRIEVPIPSWPAAPKRLIRISAQLYNHDRDYDALAAALAREL
ncbi:MAG: aminotransferase, partial [Myxococcales bacterium]|nr:aminotransferase [Myxococcales bacterium]